MENEKKADNIAQCRACLGYVRPDTATAPCHAMRLAGAGLH